MASITKINQGVSMDTPTSPPLTGLFSRAAFYIASLDLPLLMIRIIALSNAFFLLSLVYMILVPNAPLGVLRFLQEDTGMRRNTLVALVAAFFFMDIAQSMRGVVTSYSMVMSLSGQAAVALITAIYVIKGDLSAIALYSHGGAFALSAIGVLIGIQSRHTNLRYPVKRLILPALSTLMFILVWGLITRPDSPLALFIQNTYGKVFFILLVGALAWGSGQLRRNHFSPEKMARRLTGIYLFAFLVVALQITTGGSSLLGVYMTVHVAVLSMVFPFLQATDQGGS